MEKIKTTLFWTLLIGLFLGSGYQTYALVDLSTQLNENGISFGKAKANYNFLTSSGSLSELPDMAGGC